MAAKKKSAKKSRVKKATSKKKVVVKKTTAKKTAKKKTAKKSAGKPRKTPVKKAARKKTSSLKKAVRKKPLKKSSAKKKSGKRTSAGVKSPAVNKRKSVKKPATAVKPRSTRAVTEVQPFKPYKPIRNEEYMNASQSEHFRTILLDWKKLLMEEVDRTVHHMQDEAANFPDPNDRATQEEEFALELRTRDRERKLIRKIDEAILSIETGDYGYCEVCGVEIGIKRLEARPTATLCIDCKTLDEIKEKQLG